MSSANSALTAVQLGCRRAAGQWRHRDPPRCARSGQPEHLRDGNGCSRCQPAASRKSIRRSKSPPSASSSTGNPRNSGSEVRRRRGLARFIARECPLAFATAIAESGSTALGTADGYSGCSWWRAYYWMRCHCVRQVDLRGGSRPLPTIPDALTGLVITASIERWQWPHWLDSRWGMLERGEPLGFQACLSRTCKRRCGCSSPQQSVGLRVKWLILATRTLHVGQDDLIPSINAVLPPLIQSRPCGYLWS